MSRKRRRSYKSRKSSDTRENEHMPVICRCQQMLLHEGVEGRGNEHPAEANNHEAEDMGQSDKNRINHSCTLENGRKNNEGALENREEENISDSVKEGKQEKDFPLLAFSTRQDEVLAVISVDESETSTGSITLECNSSSVRSPQSENAFIAEVKCGSFNMKVEVKKDSLSGAGSASGKWKCPKNRCYHKGHCCKQHEEQRPSTNLPGKYATPFKCTIQMASNPNPTMSISIVEKEIKVQYINRKQKLRVSIEPGVKARKCGPARSSKYGNMSSDTDYSTTEESYSDFESDFSIQEKEESFTSYMGPEWYAPIPPPAEFADSEEICLDSATEVVSLSPAGDVNMSDTFSAALNCGEGSDLCQAKGDRRKECANGKDFYKEMVFSEFSYTGESPPKVCSSREIYPVKKPNDETSDAHQVRNNSLIDTRNMMLVSHMEGKNTRSNSFPAAPVDILSSFHPRRDSGFYSMPSLSLKVLPKPSKASNPYSKNAHTPTSCTELSSSFASLFGNLRDLKCCYSFTSYDHEMTVYHAELEEKLGNAFFMDHSLEYIENCREMDWVAGGDFHSIVKSNEEHKEECRPIEPLRTLDVSEEYNELANGGNDCEVLSSDHYKVQANIELQNEELLNQVSLLSGNQSNDYKDDNSIAATESTQGQFSAEQPNGNHQLSIAESDITKKWRRSVMTVITGELERRLIIQGDRKSVAESFDLAIKKEPFLPCSIREAFMSPLLDAEEPDFDNESQSSAEVEEMSEDMHEDCRDASAQADAVSCSLEDEQVLADTEAPEMLSSKQDICSSDLSGKHLATDQIEELLKPSCEKPEVQSEIKTDLGQSPDTLPPNHQTDNVAAALEDTGKILSDEQASNDASSSHEEAVDRWARRRKQFQNSKRCGSAGGSSIISSITEGSVNSEDGRSVDLGLRGESEERGFYTEIFHSMSWVFRGDDASPNNSPRCLSKRPRPVAVRERTVRIAKGTGDYPWGFRIQFSKPILVTEVDTNSSAEEAGLQIGDIVMAVNGTDVSSMPHSEAANLARKGPDILTLLVGSDISRCPNTPRPTCRGYLHKRTQSGILKGWRKRWFVLKHDGCLYYYKHKKDEGKCRPLEVTKLEGAEIGVDSSLGKPFVFKCIPQTGNRIFYFCATSNQEMKRWLEAMEKAVHPVHQNHVWVDVTMHNTSLPPLAIKNPECLGLLHQLDKSKDMWVQHYCILKDGCLYFYPSIRSTHALGGIYLQGYTVSEQALGSRRSVIEVKPPSEEFKTFYLCAESVTENKRWITALGASVSKWLPLNQAIQDFMNRPLEETKM
ncbi:uncharacterized protein LOC118076873 [Zootoca vivipara]|uniref:uncharacterized protein LOC118076873 n=1 Tax=Zootoca vivipara TaxID=8524 RepID=UPI00293BD138|nr:uncharacterized protein LOC118076873 [Zootoca vivipara]